MVFVKNGYKFKSLYILYMGHNLIGDQGFINFLDNFKEFNVLKKVHFHKNQITFKSSEALYRNRKEIA
jgi:hypothetical protein